ncbi:MAG: helix-turn-helix domain-containing protein [Gammaproteobacteria bacterium]|nr:helix-turn-helix domain-containing protein [Gammaproteobacteria bacterium]
MIIEKNSKRAEIVIPTVGEARAIDPSIYEQLVQPWELCNTPTKAGNFGYHIRYVTMPGITLYREKFDIGCRLQGLSPANIFAVGVPLPSGMRSVYWGKSVCDSSLPIGLPGGMSTLLRKGHDHIVLLVEMYLLADYLLPEHYQALQHVADNHQLPSSSVKVKCFGQWLLGLLNNAYHKPDMLKSSAAVQSIREDLLNQLMNLIEVPYPSPPKAKLSRRKQGMEQALEFLREVDITSVSIPEISQSAGVSLRTLEYAFLDNFELTPLAYLRLQRMHAARRTLLVSSPDTTTVAAVACEHGFYQPAKFAIDYRRLFNEPPSKALKHPFMENELSPLIC